MLISKEPEVVWKIKRMNYCFNHRDQFKFHWVLCECKGSGWSYIRVFLCEFYRFVQFVKKAIWNVIQYDILITYLIRIITKDGIDREVVILCSNWCCTYVRRNCLGNCFCSSTINYMNANKKQPHFFYVNILFTLNWHESWNEEKLIFTF